MPTSPFKRADYKFTKSATTSMALKELSIHSMTDDSPVPNNVWRSPNVIVDEIKYVPEGTKTLSWAARAF